MHVPTDRPLASWIRELISAGKLYLFYKSPEWLALRNEVMEDHHWECEKCARLGAWEKAGGSWRRSERVFLRRAETVHHEHEVRKRPELALTRWEEDAAGNRRELLHPICNLCHNEEHERTLKGNKPKPPITTERWD